MQAARGASLSDAGILTERRRPRVAALLVTALLVYAADQAAKVMAVDRLSGRDPVELLGGLITLRLIRNPGAAFGIAGSATIIFTLVAVVVAVMILRTARHLHSVPWALALGLLLGGALGNLTDRVLRSPGLLRGHVVDFLELPNWPVFNLADSAICVGAVLIVVLTLLGRGMDGQVHRD